MWHGYILVEHLPPGWTQSERGAAWSALRGMGKHSDAQPRNITHSRLRPDEESLIVECELAAAPVRADLVAVIAAALGVQAAAVDAKVGITIFADGAACRAQLAAQRGLWEAEG